MDKDRIREFLWVVDTVCAGDESRRRAMVAALIRMQGPASFEMISLMTGLSGEQISAGERKVESIIENKLAKLRGTAVVGARPDGAVCVIGGPRQSRVRVPQAAAAVAAGESPEAMTASYKSSAGYGITPAQPNPTRYQHAPGEERGHVQSIFDKVRDQIKRENFFTGTAMDTLDLIRAPAGNRDPNLIGAINQILQRSSGSSDKTPLMWSIMDLYDIADNLKAMGYDQSFKSIRNILAEQNYFLTGPYGITSHHDIIAGNFADINNKVANYIKRGVPVVYSYAQNFLLPNDAYESISAHKRLTRDQLSRTMELATEHENFDYELYRHSIVYLDRQRLDFAFDTILKWWEDAGSSVYGNARELCLICNWFVCRAEGEADYINECTEDLIEFFGETSLDQVQMMEGNYKWQCVTSSQSYSFSRPAGPDSTAMTVITIQTLG
ncbi:hypothetical protein [Anaerobiospirillum sp. NML120449]|uniref:ISAzo13-like element transposase-related protein n=1 Tax=Anaerobiospirillum sp. NML120449 TaxID=2932817 RepID=UPI001FF3778E|nr:hypothetical protein [Anaerobiospirillum sp. NML120449]MCK0527170.1 hypothetical protein [Anaerobiospirillum sp. NML120449]